MIKNIVNKLEDQISEKFLKKTESTWASFISFNTMYIKTSLIHNIAVISRKIRNEFSIK